MGVACVTFLPVAAITRLKMPIRTDATRPLTQVDIDSLSDAELLADASLPADTFAAFYRRHVHAILRFSAGRGLPADLAADVASETFFAALRGRYRYRPERETARLWLLAIAARQAANTHRQRSADHRKHDRLRSEAIALTDVDRNGYEQLRTQIDQRGLNALNDLPQAQRDAIHARVIEDRDYGEIAAAMGMSQPAVRQSVSRGLAALRRLLKETP